MGNLESLELFDDVQKEIPAYLRYVWVLRKVGLLAQNCPFVMRRSISFTYISEIKIILI